MHPFRVLFGGLLLAATTILALPTGNLPRSLAASNNNLVARNPPEVTFGGQVPAEHHAAITTAVHAHHASLAHDDPRKAAVKAHVNKGWHHTPGEEHLPEHATFRYHGPGARNQKSQIGQGVHVNKPARRNLPEVTFGGQVPAEHHAAITTAVHAHHASLAHDDPRKAAVKAHVNKGWHHTPGEEHLPEHATFRYHGPGARNQKSQIGQGVHVNKPARRNLPEVTFGGQVPAEHHAAITTAVHAHHASLAHDDPRKAAVKAHVNKGWHHTPGEEHLPEHATFRYHGPGARNQKSQIGQGVHVNKP